VAVAWNLFSQTQRVAKRTQARLQLHATAKTVYESLRRDLMTMQQHCATWLTSTAAPGRIDLVFMAAAMDEAGYQMKGGWSNVPVADLVWVGWRWDAATKSLSSARSPSTRQWHLDPTIDGIPANPANLAETLNIGPWFPSIPRIDFWPQPRRFTTGDALSGLDDNRWRLSTASGNAVGAARNLGDWSDLQRRFGPVCNGMESCTIELVQAGRDAGGNLRTIHADGQSPLDFCAHGIRMDGVASTQVSNAPAAIVGFADEIDERPLLLRISFVLLDAPTAVSIPFSFSIALPGPGMQP
jgi:hypothetical protein